MKQLIMLFAISILTIAIFACGPAIGRAVGDAEVVVDLKARILDIQTNKVDPVIKELQEISAQIAPIEAEIQELEDSKSKLYEESDSLAKEFEDSMQDHFTFLFTQSDDLKLEQETEMKKEYKKLRQLEDELSAMWEEEEEEMRDRFDAKQIQIEFQIEQKMKDSEYELRQMENDNEAFEKALRRTIENEIEEREAQFNKDMEEYSETHPGILASQSLVSQSDDLAERRMELELQSLDHQQNLMPIENMIEYLQREQEFILGQITAVQQNSNLSAEDKSQQESELTNQMELYDAQIKSLEEDRAQKMRDFQSIEEKSFALTREEIQLQEILNDWQKEWGDSLERDMEEGIEKLLNEFEKNIDQLTQDYETQVNSMREESERSSRQLSDELGDEEKTLMEDLRESAEQADKELQKKYEAEYGKVEASMEALSVKEKDLDSFLDQERQLQIEGLESQKDVMYEERMKPLEDKINAVDEKIASKWGSLEVLYKQQTKLSEKLEVLEREVRELDRQVEFGLLSVISGAIDNASGQGLTSPVDDSGRVDLSGKLDIGPGQKK
tara:strand:- start:780 stop:2450 length:1671 start_codon:yes stop_codon:yes gene_type:complete